MHFDINRKDPKIIGLGPWWWWCCDAPFNATEPRLSIFRQLTASSGLSAKRRPWINGGRQVSGGAGGPAGKHHSDCGCSCCWGLCSGGLPPAPGCSCGCRSGDTGAGEWLGSISAFQRQGFSQFCFLLAKAMWISSPLFAAEVKLIRIYSEKQLGELILWILHCILLLGGNLPEGGPPWHCGDCHEKSHAECVYAYDKTRGGGPIQSMAADFPRSFRSWGGGESSGRGREG